MVVIFCGRLSVRFKVVCVAHTRRAKLLAMIFFDEDANWYFSTKGMCVGCKKKPFNYMQARWHMVIAFERQHLTQTLSHSFSWCTCSITSHQIRCWELDNRNIDNADSEILMFSSFLAINSLSLYLT
jgi:hypothetical protein